MCVPILVTLLKMQPHYSQSSRENETPSSGTSPLANYKKVPPPGGGGVRRPQYCGLSVIWTNGLRLLRATAIQWLQAAVQYHNIYWQSYKIKSH